MDGLQDSTSGAITTAIDGIKTETTGQNDRIAAEQERIDQLQQNLIAQMAAADSAIAILEQQATYMNGLFEAMRNINLNR